MSTLKQKFKDFKKNQKTTANEEMPGETPKNASCDFSAITDSLQEILGNQHEILDALACLNNASEQSAYNPDSGSGVPLDMGAFRSLVFNNVILALKAVSDGRLPMPFFSSKRGDELIAEMRKLADSVSDGVYKIPEEITRLLAVAEQTKNTLNDILPHILSVDNDELEHRRNVIKRLDALNSYFRKMTGIIENEKPIISEDSSFIDRLFFYPKRLRYKILNEWNEPRWFFVWRYWRGMCIVMLSIVAICFFFKVQLQESYIQQYRTVQMKYGIAREWAIAENDTTMEDRFMLLDCCFSDTVQYSEQLKNIRNYIEVQKQRHDGN